ncbi:hypothetical protein L7F22_053622 [Adiantum nelumboides]|nr:hypothetical protein [Adiantum nelumboides]
MTTVEKDHTAVEHMVMALMFAVGKFRPYLLPKKFVILTLEENFPLVLQHMDVSTRISKWCYEKKLKVKPTMIKVEEEVSKLGEAHSLYFDGAHKRKVDKAAVGVVIYDEEGRKVFGKGLMLENVHSNNEAEYGALSLGLEWCLNLGIKRLNAFGDALLLVKQVHGTWACRNQGLVVRLHRVKELLKRFEVAHLLHVPRKDNQEADALASEKLQDVTIGAVALQQPQFQGNDCMPDILHFLETDKCLDGLSKGVCGGHFSHDITSKKILQAGDRRLTYEPQTPILAHGPFEKWGIDAIGPLPRATSGKLYIIMGVDYMTKWAEATTTSRITAVEVAKFIFEHICCRFGVPLEILSDRGSGFRGDLVGELMKKLKIKRRHSTPYYPQCNGLVEKVNGMICKIITKQVVSKPKEWDKHLEAALWSYRTSFRTSLGYTPYHLVFGKEAILPIEV